MPGLTQASDRGTQYKSYAREAWTFRPISGSTYAPGMILQLVSQDLQVYVDESTAQPTPTTASQQKLCGVVTEWWSGFGGNITPGQNAAPSNMGAVRGTLLVPAVTKGFHPAVLIDQSGTGAVTLTDGLQIVNSRATVGYGQGLGATTAAGMSGVIAVAALPASGIGSSITAAALAQASQTDTLTGTPAVGDTLSVTIQSPYVSTAAGTAQTITWTTPGLTAAQAVSVTTAAAALVAYLNSVSSFSTYFTASNVAGVVTITVNALGSLFGVNFGPGIDGQAMANYFSISLSGMIANSLTFAVSSTGGTTSTAGGANLAGGTGFKGTIPAFVCSAL